MVSRELENEDYYKIILLFDFPWFFKIMIMQTRDNEVLSVDSVIEIRVRKDPDACITMDLIYRLRILFLILH